MGAGVRVQINQTETVRENVKGEGLGGGEECRHTRRHARQTGREELEGRLPAACYRQVQVHRR